MRVVTPEAWYEARTLDDGVTLIHEPHVVPFYRCNMWHVRGRGQDLLIDSGSGLVPLRKHVPLLSGRPLLAVASHTHFDHIGAHHEFERRAVHEAEAAILANPTRVTTLADPYATDEMFTSLPPLKGGWQASRYAVKAAPAHILLKHGDAIDLGDRRLEVIHTPGHSPGGIALFERSSGVLFSGDIVYDGPLIEDTYHADAADYIRSMERLLALPVRVVHGGHYPSYGAERHREIVRSWLRGKGR